MKLFTNKTKKTLELVGLLGIFSNGGYAYGESLVLKLKPITKITNSELKIIENASRQSGISQLINAESFSVNRDGIVKILFKDGSEKLFGYSGGNFSGIIDENSSDKESNYRIEASRIGSEFLTVSTYRRYDTYENEKPEPLLRLDELVSDYVALLNGNLSHLNNNSPPYLGDIVIRGNRYFRSLEPLVPYFNTQTAIEFYDGYIYSGKALKEDIPSDEEKKEAIRKIRNLIISDKENILQIYFNLYSTEEIKRLDPETYEELKELKREYM
ncbi:hypothetical protein HYX19_02285 [Candidatus Woesearchaeota archaeon]|nr:hypothetical protein [Candidatus Woesearchaeota archaeon]